MRGRTIRSFAGAGALFLLACSSQTFSSGKIGTTGTDGGSTGGGGAGGSGAASSGGAPGGGGSSGASAGGASGAAGSPVDAGAAGAGGVLTDAGSIRCTGTDPSFPVFDRGCTNTDSCVLVSHVTSCCGSSTLMGINHAERARFDAAEAICDAQYPACGCASFGITLDDGTLVASANEAIVECVNGQCESRYNGGTFACGSKTCTDVQYCTQASGGPAGSPTTFTCTEDPNCAKSCGNCSSLSIGCACNTVEGHTTITCAYP